MMQSLLGNADFMQSIMQMNPETRELMQANPELARAMQDPETMRQMAAAARNPALLAELMRGQDRALANIEMLPGGQNALRRMYETVQEPLERGMREGGGGDEAQPQQPAPAADAPLPNPWAPAPHAGPRGLGASSPTLGVFAARAGSCRAVTLDEKEGQRRVCRRTRHRSATHTSPRRRWRAALQPRGPHGGHAPPGGAGGGATPPVRPSP